MTAIRHYTLTVSRRDGDGHEGGPFTQHFDNIESTLDHLVDVVEGFEAMPDVSHEMGLQLNHAARQLIVDVHAGKFCVEGYASEVHAVVPEQGRIKITLKREVDVQLAQTNFVGV